LADKPKEPRQDKKKVVFGLLWGQDITVLEGLDSWRVGGKAPRMTSIDRAPAGPSITWSNEVVDNSGRRGPSPAMRKASGVSCTPDNSCHGHRTTAAAFRSEELEKEGKGPGGRGRTRRWHAGASRRPEAANKVSGGCTASGVSQLSNAALTRAAPVWNQPQTARSDSDYNAASHIGRPGQASRPDADRHLDQPFLTRDEVFLGERRVDYATRPSA